MPSSDAEVGVHHRHDLQDAKDRRQINADDPPSAIVVLGMIAYFVGVVRAPLTAVISETTASRGLIVPLFATALIADAVSAWVCPTRL